MVWFGRRPASWGRCLQIICMAGLVTFISSGSLAQDASRLVVQNDRGGLIGARAIEIEQINARSTRVELRGRICYSSCTMYLGAADVCISPDTTFGFHGPSQRGVALAPAQFDHWSEVMAAHYNTSLRTWFMQEARHRIDGYYRISGAQIIALGYPSC